MSKTIRQYISQIRVNKPNLDYISKTGKINGSLLISIEEIMRDYRQSQTQELIEQNRELVECMKWLLKGHNLSSYDRTMITELLIKHKQS